MTDNNLLIAGDTSDSDAEGFVAKPSIDLELLNNIPVTISVEVGRASLKIKDLMRLTQGSVVELERLAGEPLDLLVNNTLVAQGEVVLVNERYGVRLTQVIPPAERIKTI
jgi:flagellar motor switch protein FliN/FliY